MVLPDPYILALQCESAACYGFYNPWLVNTPCHTCPVKVMCATTTRQKIMVLAATSTTSFNRSTASGDLDLDALLQSLPQARTADSLSVDPVIKDLFGEDSAKTLDSLSLRMTAKAPTMCKKCGTTIAVGASMILHDNQPFHQGCEPGR